MPELGKPKYAPNGQVKVAVSARIDPRAWRRHAAAAKRLGWNRSSYIAALLEWTDPLVPRKHVPR